MKVDSPEYKTLMAKWSEEAFQEELNTEFESYLENEDAHGRLPVANIVTLEEHTLSDGSTVKVTKLGRTYSFHHLGGPMEAPESSIGITKEEAYRLLEEALRDDVLELDS